MVVARQVMNTSPVVVGPKLPLAQLPRVLSSHASDCACVVDGTEVVGVVTSVDLCWVEGKPNQPFIDLMFARDGEEATGFVADVMSTPSQVLQPDTPIEHIMDLLFHQQLSVLPVLEGAELVGMVTRKSVVQALAFGC